MNELHFAYRVRQILNHGVHEMRPETVARLSEARKLALAGNHAPHHFSSFGFKQVVVSLALVVSVVFSAFWVADQRVNELSAIDSALLADDLPIGVFTDKGFDAWLKRGS